VLGGVRRTVVSLSAQSRASLTSMMPSRFHRRMAPRLFTTARALYRMWGEGFLAGIARNVNGWRAFDQGGAANHQTFMRNIWLSLDCRS